MQIGYEKTRIHTFLETLSSSAPTPGGGSVAALCGAMAASLVLMVCNLTVGKEKFAEAGQELKTIMDEALRLRGGLVRGVDEDMQAYREVMACYRLPKGTQQEKISRKERLQAALRNATEVPYRTALSCWRVLELNQRLPQIGNPNAVSDVGVSVHLAAAALRSALYNVDINCNYIEDAEFVEDYRARRTSLSERAAGMEADIVKEVHVRLSPPTAR